MPEQVADHAQRQAAVDPANSFIVQAPAGSGKTELLTNRFLRLLALVDRPQRVLAITFTRKATQEMLDRVLGKLRQAQAGRLPSEVHEQEAYHYAQEVLARDREFGWNLLLNPAQLQIHTIDGLCARLAARGDETGRGMAVQRIAEDPSPLYQEAARRLIERIANDDDGAAAAALAALLVRLRGNAKALQELLVRELERRDQWLEEVASRAGSSRAVLEFRQSFELQQLEIALGREELARLACIQNVPDLVHGAGGDPGARVLAAHQALKGLAIQSGHPMAARSVRKSLAGRSDPPGAEVVEDVVQLCETWRSDPGAVTMFERFVNAPPLDLDHGNDELMTWMHELLVQACAELYVLFAEQGACDFQYIAGLAMNALGGDLEPGEALLLEDGRLEHILLDEFQDTSHIQYELLQRLTAGWQRDDGRSLFLVGDPMQSIYRFRKADVSLFSATYASGQLGTVFLQPLRLESNFRSCEEIIDFVNHHFPGIFAAPSPAATGAVAYVPVNAERSAGGRVCLHPIAHERGVSGEAGEIVALITVLKRRDPEARIGVLGRGRRQLEGVAEALGQAAIAFEAVDVQELAGRPVVQDLLTITRALLHPADRVAWLALLHAPWCGLEPGELLLLAGDSCTRDPLQFLAEAPGVESLPATKRERLQRLWAVMCESLEAASSLSLHRRVEAAWIRLRGPCTAASAVDLADAQSFLDLLARVEAERPADLAGMLSVYLDKLRAGSVQSRVQLMTIHKAKGLQFDHVILPGLDGRSGSRSKALFRQQDFRHAGQEGTLLAPVKPSGSTEPSLYDYLDRLDREEEVSEAQRVLYVALTRARQELHLFGRWKMKGSAGKKAPGATTGSFMHMLWPAFEAAIRETDMVTGSLAEPIVDSTQEGLPMLVLEGEPAPGISPAQRDVGTEAKIDWLMPDRDALALGDALHQWLELIHDHWSLEWLGDWYESHRPALESSMLAAGARQASIPQLLPELIDMLKRVLQSPSGQAMVSPEGKDSSLAEVRFMHAEGDTLRSSILDLLYREKEGGWIIIDYKTGQGGEDTRQAWAEQLSRYRATVVDALEEEVGGCFIYNARNGTKLDPLD